MDEHLLHVAGRAKAAIPDSANPRHESNVRFKCSSKTGQPHFQPMRAVKLTDRATGTDLTPTEASRMLRDQPRGAPPQGLRDRKPARNAAAR